VNEAAKNVKPKPTDQPEHQKNDCDCPKHNFASDARLPTAVRKESRGRDSRWKSAVFGNRIAA
jgi:hypothetical protein